MDEAPKTSIGSNKDTPWYDYIGTPAGKAAAQNALAESIALSGVIGADSSQEKERARVEHERVKQENYPRNAMQISDIANGYKLKFSNTGNLRYDTESLLMSIPGQEKTLAELRGGKEPQEILIAYEKICDQIISSGDERFTYSAVVVKRQIKKLLQLNDDKQTIENLREKIQKLLQ